MSSNLLKKFIASCLLVSIPFGYFPISFLVPAKIKAQTETVGNNINDEIINEDEGDAYNQPDPEQPQRILANVLPETLTSGLKKAVSSMDEGVAFEDLFGTTNAKIVLKQSDYLAVKSLYCISESFSDYPDYDNDVNLLAKVSGKTTAELTELKDNSDPAKRQDYRDIVREALNSWATQAKVINNLQNSADNRLLECITGYSSNQIAELKLKSDKSELNSIIEDAVNSLKLDLRVIKTLVYLVTPKNKGGAGHYRIRVSRIFGNKNKPYSTESDAVIEGQNSAGSTSGKTAADIGALQNSNAFATIEDETGQTQADVYLEGQMAADDSATTVSSSTERNISAHSVGQAVDISEVDDVRCTVVGRKRIGKATITQKPAQPTKLAYQTDEGYSQSGGANANDLMELMRQSATQSMRDLAGDFGADITAYDGDLSNANISDLATIIGKSLFADIINSPGDFIEGFNVEDTMTKLGAMYLADYLGVPRQVFVNRNISSVGYLDDVAMLVGEASIETKLNLPIGFLEPAPAFSNQQSSLQSLDKTLQNIGRRKLAIEMNLNPNDLLDYSAGGTDGLVFLAGQKAIEKALSLPPGSFTGKNFNEIKASIGWVQAELLIRDPGYADQVLHIPLGSTKKMIDAPDNEAELNRYIATVGTKRNEDTIKGFQYLSAHSTAYGLPFETWKGAVEGDTDKFREVGTFMVANAFAEDGANDQKQAITKWIKNTLNISDDNGAIETASCLETETITRKIAITKPVQQNDDTGQTVTVLVPTGEYKDVAISEATAEKAGLASGDLCQLYGQASGNARAVYERYGEKILYYAFVNAAVNGDGVKVNLSDDPDYKITNSDVLFYTSRLEKSRKLAKKVKQDYETIEKDEALAADNDLKSDLADFAALIEGFSLTQFNLNQMKGNAKKISGKAATLKARLQAKRLQYPDLADKINILILDVNTLYRTLSEMVEGKALPSSYNLTEAQLKTAKLAQSNQNGASKSKGSVVLSPAVILYFLAGKISPRQFFQNIATQKVETELDLPANSLTYYIQNMETRGIGGLDAFYQAIGQAKVEDQLGLPAYYFQGPIYQGAPDFNKLGCALGSEWTFHVSKKSADLYKDLVKYYKLSGAKIKHYDPDKGYVNLENEAEACNLAVTARSPDSYKYNEAQQVWKQISRAATKAYIQDQNTSNKNNDNTIADMAKNAEYHQLTDGLRSGATDVMFRFGLSGSLDAASMAGNWDFPTFAGNRNRANQIDRDLHIVPTGPSSKTSNTQALFTGQKISLQNGQNMISENDKELLAFGVDFADPTDDTNYYSVSVSEEVLNRYLQVLNGEIDQNGFSQTKTSGLYYNAFNPYANVSRVDENGACKITYTGKNGFVMADSIQSDAYVYIDSKGGKHSFKTKEQAQAFIRQQSFEEKTYLDLMSDFLVNLGKYTRDQVGEMPSPYKEKFSDSGKARSALLDFLNSGRKNDLLPMSWLRSKLLDEQLSLSGLGFNDSSFDNEGLIGPFSLKLLNDLFGQNQVGSPLQSYRLAVGKAEAERVLTVSILRNLGLKADQREFVSADVFAILSGDSRTLFRLGTKVIDQNLDLPTGTSYAVMHIQSQDDIRCTAADAGAQAFGRLLGLQRVDLSGDASQLLANIGQAKIEETIGLPHGSFKGENLSELINNIGYLNFILAFDIPLSGEPGSNNAIDETIESAALKVIGELLGPEAVDKYRNASVEQKLKVVIDNINYAKSYTENSSIPKLWAAVTLRISELSKVAEPNSRFWQNDQIRGETRSFLSRLNYIDSALGLDSFIGNDPTTSTTFRMLTANIRPIDYLNKAANKQIASVLAVNLGEKLGLDEQQAQAAYKLISNFNKIFNCSNDFSSNVAKAAGKKDDSCGGWSENWGAVYDGLNQIFQGNADGSAGLIPGSVEAMINNPNDTVDILLYNAADDLDKKFNLDSIQADSGGGTTTAITNAAYAAAGKIGVFKTLYSRYSANPDNWQGVTAAMRADFRAGCSANFLDSMSDKDKLQYNQSKNETLRSMLRERAINNCIDQKVEERKLFCADPDNYQPFMNGQSANMDQNISRAIENCESNRRNDGGSNESKIKQALSQLGSVKTIISNRIGSAISTATHGTLIMPAGDINELVFNGDLRYLEIAGLSYAMNRFINETGQEDQLPSGLQVSYADIKFAIVGDADSESYGAVAAQYPLVTDAAVTVPGEQARPFGSTIHGPVAGSDDPIQQIVRNHNAGTGAARTPDNIAAGERYAMRHNTGIQVSDAEMVAKVQAQRVQLESKEATNRGIIASRACQSYDPAAETTATPTAEQTACEQAVYDQAQLKAMRQAEEQGKKETRANFREALEYRLMDATLWKMDKNVYPGFAWDLIKGNGETKLKALGTYLLNGAENGKLFGTDIHKISDAAEWALAIDHIVNLNRPGELDDFLSNRDKSFAFFKTKFSEFVSNAIDFKLPEGTIDAILVGVSTGNWGMSGNNITDGYYAGAKGKLHAPTLQRAATNELKRLVFNWADKQLHIPAGTIYQAYSLYDQMRKAQAARDAFNAGAIRAAWDNVQNLNGVVKTGGKVTVSTGTYIKQADGTFKNIETGKSIDANGLGLQQASDQQQKLESNLDTAKVAVVTFAVTTIIDKLFSKSFASVDDSLNLAPGTTQMMAGIAISVGVPMAMKALGMIAKTGIQPWMIYVQLGMILYMNLFGVYRTDVRCTADGFYSTGNNASDDQKARDAVNSTGIPTWDGLNIVTHQQNTILAAQTRARQLIGDLLQMQYNPLYRDVIPNQIMTGRAEDVAYWNQLVDDNVCKKMGEGYFAANGICASGSPDNPAGTRAGLWENPQTVSFTHIGF